MRKGTTTEWMAGSLVVGLAIVVIVRWVATPGAKVGVALQATARWSFILFWLAYTGNALATLALGGVIGAGPVRRQRRSHQGGRTGGRDLLLITGQLVVLVMRMLGEMAVALPAVGSFYEYSRLAWSDRPRLGELAGFLTGWMYWYFWVIVVALEAVAGAALIRFWFPNEPAWAISLAMMLLLTLTNLFSVRSYGEFEFWFASIKVGGDRRLPDPGGPSHTCSACGRAPAPSAHQPHGRTADSPRTAYCPSSPGRWRPPASTSAQRS